MMRLPIIAFFSCELMYPILALLTTVEIAIVGCNMLVAFFLIWSLFVNKNNIKALPLAIVVFSVTAFIITGIIYPEYQEVLYAGKDSLGTVFALRGGMTLMLLLTLVNDPRDIFDALKISAIPIWIAYTIRSILGFAVSGDMNYNHTYGYAFLFVSIIYLICFIRERKFWHLAISLIALWQVIMYASRTAFLSYVVFLALYVLFYDNDKKLKKRKIAFVAFGVVLAFVVTSDAFLSFFSYFVKEAGVSSKIIDSIVTGENELDGGRAHAYELAQSLIKKNPLGLGVYWDRYYCDISYVHSFIYEILLDFGWFFGGFILWWIAKNTIAILRSNEKNWKILFMFFFSLCMIRLTLSYSFWLDQNFWGMIAIITGYRYATRKRA